MLEHKKSDGKELRDKAKAHTFGPLYGKNSGSKDEQKYYQAFKEKYHVCHSAQNSWVEEVLKTKRFRTATGLIFYWPDTEVTSSGFITNSNNIFNYPIQMFATADLAPTAVCLLWHQLYAEGMKSFLINEVHDSCVIEEAPDEGEKLGNLVEQTMTADVIDFMDKVIGFKIDFPIRIEQESHSHWGAELLDKTTV